MKYYILKFLLLIAFSNLLEAQVSIPYGNCTGYDSRYNLDGRSWNCRFLTYAFDNGTPDITGDIEQNVIKNSFEKWESVTNIEFIRTCNTSDADIQIGWRVNNHEDSFLFDGPACQLGGRLAHSFFPPPNTESTFKKFHFDEDETWSLNGNSECNNMDLESISLHEIGHIIGINHSNINNVVMEGNYEGQRRFLLQDDIDAAQAIYGIKTNPIQGNNISCGNPFSTFSVCLHQGLEYTWSVPNGLIITSGQGTNEINVQRTSEGCGEGNISVTISTECDQITYNKYVSYCCNIPPTPYHSFIIYDEINCCYNFGMLFPNSQCYSKFHWQINGAHYYTSQPVLNVCFDSRITKYFSIGVSIINDCGESSVFWNYLIAQPFIGLLCSERTNNFDIEIYPNPTDGELFIDLSKLGIQDNELVYIRVLNLMGERVFSSAELGRNLELSTSTLSTGVYYIGISSGSIEIIKKFIVAR